MPFKTHFAVFLKEDQQQDHGVFCEVSVSSFFFPNLRLDGIAISGIELFPFVYKSTQILNYFFFWSLQVNILYYIPLSRYLYTFSCKLKVKKESP